MTAYLEKQSWSRESRVASQRASYLTSTEIAALNSRIFQATAVKLPLSESTIFNNPPVVGLSVSYDNI